MSQWLFDLGNTRLKFAPRQSQGAGPVHVWTHQDQERPLPELSDLPRGSVAWVASVADPQLRDRLVSRLAQCFDRVEVAASQAGCGRLRSGYADPSRLGVDRFLALLASSQAARDCLVVGVGTALTVDLLGADGRHHGGLIAPSPTSMRQAMHLKAAHLPATGGQEVAFADNTLDALAGGSLGAALGLIERCLRKGTALLGVPLDLVVHGGGADPLLPHLPMARHVPGLVLDGLSAWAVQQNRETA